MLTPIFETLLTQYKRQPGIDLSPTLWGDRTLTWFQQDLFGTPEARNDLYLIQSAFEEFSQAPTKKRECLGQYQGTRSSLCAGDRT
jgi:hypothetical protein